MVFLHFSVPHLGEIILSILAVVWDPSNLPIWHEVSSTFGGVLPLLHQISFLDSWSYTILCIYIYTHYKQCIYIHYIIHTMYIYIYIHTIHIYNIYMCIYTYIYYVYIYIHTHTYIQMCNQLIRQSFHRISHPHATGDCFFFFFSGACPNVSSHIPIDGLGCYALRTWLVDIPLYIYIYSVLYVYTYIYIYTYIHIYIYTPSII